MNRREASRAQLESGTAASNWRRRAGLVALLAALVGFVPSSSAVVLVATNGSSLTRFDAGNPSSVTNVAVTGLQSGETLVGIDFRPATGQLYGIGSTSRVYVLNYTTGAATQVGSVPLNPALNGTAFGSDFNPVLDHLREVSNTEQNQRLNPDSGSVAGHDPALQPAGNVVAVAYDRNYLRPPGDTTPTTLFGIDSAAGTLVRIGGVDGNPSPNGGAVTTIGSLALGPNLNENIGFDIGPDDIAYATITTSSISRLYLINRTTGGAALAGTIGNGSVSFHSVSVVIPPPLVVFSTANSGGGSLRQVITDANAKLNPDPESEPPDVIKFNISGAGPHIITAATALPVIKHFVVIDGTSQPGFDPASGAPVIVLKGNSSDAGLDLQTGAASSSIIKGLQIVGFHFGIHMVDAAHVTVQGCRIGTDGTATSLGNSIGIYVSGNSFSVHIGGTAAGAGNLISGNETGVDLEAPGGVLEGNFIGLNAAGTAVIPNGRGVACNTSVAVNTRIGGTVPGAGNVVSGNSEVGILVSSGVAGWQIMGNRIGTDPAGTAAIGNAVGIRLGFISHDNVVGGTTAAAANLISGNTVGVRVDFCHDNTIQGNRIGTTADGTSPLGNTGAGIEVLSSDSVSNVTPRNLIGGLAPDAGNLIAFNGGPGVLMAPNEHVMLNAVRRNSIHSNGGLGIDLAPGDQRGSTPNDTADADTGPNGLQNAPVITAALGSTDGTHVIGFLNSKPNTEYFIDFYYAGATDNQGRTYFGGTSGLTDADGNLSFDINYPVVGGPRVTATATTAAESPFGDTSEFADAVAINGPGSFRFNAATLSVDEAVGAAVVTVERVSGSNGAVSVAYSTADGSAHQPDDYSAASGTLFFNDGQTTATITVPINDDAADEPDETLQISINGPSNGATIVEPASATVTVVDNDAPPALANISTRLRVETGENVLIGGFIITGSQPKKLIVRAIGPSLPVEGKLLNPVLELYNSANELITTNDNWVDAPNTQEIIDSTVPPSNDLESAILTTLPADANRYTAIVRGLNDTTGVGLVEVYDLDRSVDSKLANISTRGLVQTGDDVLIGGIIAVGGNPLKVIVRAIGPSLPVSNALVDPTLQLYGLNGELVAENDDWRSDQEQEIIDTTVPPSSDAESAIVRTLSPGNYTAIVRGVNGTTGVGLVEVYNLQ